MADRTIALAEYGKVVCLGRGEAIMAWLIERRPSSPRLLIILVLGASLYWRDWGEYGTGSLLVLVGLGLVAAKGFAVFHSRALYQRLGRVFRGGLVIAVKGWSADKAGQFDPTSYLMFAGEELLEIDAGGSVTGRSPLPSVEFGVSPRGRLRVMTVSETRYYVRQLG